MPFIDNVLPADFNVPRIQEKKPHKSNLPIGPGYGRLKGSRDKITRDLKEGIVEGAILHGADGSGEGGLVGYCYHLAAHHPRAYTTLLARVLPHTIDASVRTQSVGMVKIVTVPSGNFVKASEMVTHGDPEVLDLAPEPNPEEPQTEDLDQASQGP